MQGEFNFWFEAQMELELIKIDSNKLGGFIDHLPIPTIEGTDKWKKVSRFEPSYRCQLD